MKKLLKNYLKICKGASESEDGQRCMIAPHPDLKKKIDAELKKLKSGLGKSLLLNKIKLEDPWRPGLNDGLIYPGSMFPAGTPADIARSAGLNKAPLRGTVRVIVVLVDFSDKPMVQTTQHFRDLFFSLGVINTGSVREYFREVTNNLVDIQGEVVGPFRLPKTLSQYANGDSGTGNAAPNARTMAKDAAVAANPSVNFAQYDNDSDGFVDAFIVIHAGTGAETNNNPNDIWSHKWVLEGGPYTADGSTKIYAYLTVPEDCRLGVCAHELGHLLFGFPDLYDIDSSSEGVGNWCLMGGGSWNNNGLTPAHPSAWCKCKQAWATAENVTSNRSNVAIEDVKSGFKVFKLWKDGAAANEYFLVENRQKQKFDRFLPNSGLLVWHIDDSVTDNSNEAHYKVALMQADGRKDLENGSNRGDAGDSYPGSANNTTFDNNSNPNSKSYGGVNTCVAIKNVSPSGAVMHADLSVKCVTKNVVKENFKEVKERKEFRKEFNKELIFEKPIFREKPFIGDKNPKEIKEKDKDIFEN
ncbi:MAG TPA: M6 family metalloprotease domain-containing protein, partial [Chitinophagaceae bacterium]|nr:M6 family metalloprotease domain-containing protein [Chitinophagaceae bacterium]